MDIKVCGFLSKKTEMWDILKKLSKSIKDWWRKRTIRDSKGVLSLLYSWVAYLARNFFWLDLYVERWVENELD